VASWQAWLIIVGLFAVPGVLLWRWRHEPSKPQARQDLEDAYDHLRAKRPADTARFEADLWRARGRMF
jgi:hypothetical protein